MDQPAKEKSRPPRILLCRTDRLGDVILALPGATLLKRMFPESRISFLVRPYTAPIVSMMESVDDVLELEDDQDMAALTAILKDHKFDGAVMLYPERQIARALKRADIPWRSGIAYRWYSSLFTYQHKEHRKGNRKHEVEYNLSLVYASLATDGRWEDLLLPQDIFPLNLVIPQLAQVRADDLLKGLTGSPLIALHPGGSGSAHRWPIQHFCALSQRLKQQGFDLMITGTSAEKNLGRVVVEAAGEGSLNLCGHLTLSELAAIYQRIRLLVTNSTGPLHLARALGTPVLGLYPPDPAMSPVRWGPYGWPNQALTPPPGQSLEHLEVKTVLARALEILGR